MSDIRALCAAVYEATDAWTFGSTSAPVTAAEQALRDALDATPPVPDECPVVAAARTVHALGGFHFDARVDREPESIGVAEAEWGRLMRTLPATSSEYAVTPEQLRRTEAITAALDALAWFKIPRTVDSIIGVYGEALGEQTRGASR